jgi:putative tryptophan/tyrosine transport system substrate-binding protein
MRRSQVLALVVPLLTLSQDEARAQPKLPTIGFMGQSTALAEGQRAAAFVQRLRELGWIEGQNVAIEFRWAEGRSERSAEIASEFVGLKVDVIATVGTPQVLAAKQATASVPIVSAAMGDPVGTGLVPNLARPGGNVTGLSAQAPDLSGKRLELLREAVPGLQRLGLMGNVGNPLVILELRELETAGRALGLDVVTAELRRAEDIAPAIDALKERAGALYIAQDLLIVTNRHRINILALGARLPVMHASRENIDTGGLLSYGPNYFVLFRRAADYVDKILRGTRPSELPIEQPTTFELVVNATTAKALGLTIPPALLARADEVIE